jgi:hypothetical protein
MPSKVFSIDHTAGQTVYAVLWDDAGNYYDFTDDAWESPSAGSDANAVRACSEVALDANATSQFKTAALDFDTVWNQWVAKNCVLRFYDQAGGSPDLSADAVIGAASFAVQLGYLDPEITLQVQPGHTSDTDPKVGTWWATVLADGHPIDMNGIDGTKPTLVVELWKEGAGAAFLTSGATSVTAADGRYYVTFSDPGFEDAGNNIRTYKAKLTLGTVVFEDSMWMAG